MSIIDIIIKRKQIILYLFFGFMTTLINVVSYYLCFNLFRINNLCSTIIAWFLSVIFAFFTNRRYVFESDKVILKQILNEMFLFFTSRIITGILDVIIMVVCVDYMKWNNLLMKILSNVIVIILNYVFSKKIIFVKSINK